MCKQVVNYWSEPMQTRSVDVYIEKQHHVQKSKKHFGWAQLEIYKEHASCARIEMFKELFNCTQRLHKESPWNAESIERACDGGICAEQCSSTHLP